MNNNPWIKISTEQRPPQNETLEFWDHDHEQVLSGSYRYYDGPHVIVGMRDWNVTRHITDFSHYRLPEPETEQPK